MKKHLNHGLVLLFSLALALGLLGSGVWAAETLEEPEPTSPGRMSADDACGENLTWTLNDAGTLTVSGTGEMDDCPSWNKQNAAIKKVVVKSGVTSVGAEAFMECENLTTVTLADSVLNLGWGAFGSCPKLTRVTVSSQADLEDVFFGTPWWESNAPKSGACGPALTWTLDDAGTLTIRGKGEMDQWYWGDRNEQVKKVVLQRGVASIGYSAFEGFTNLTHVTIPEGVTTIGDNAFYNCASLSVLTLPDSVTRIGPDAFGQCGKLARIVFEGDAPAFEADQFGAVYQGDLDAFEGVAATVYYPSGNKTWATVTKKQFVDSDLIWVKGIPPQKVNLSDCTVTLSKTSYTYNGTAKKPAVTVVYKGFTMVKGIDYTVKYAKNTNAGTAAVTITAKGTHTGTITLPFAIRKAAAAITAKNVSKAYAGKKQTVKLGAKSASPLTYKSSDKKVKVSKQGVVTIPAKYIGKAAITITGDTKNYSVKPKKVTVTVRPPALTLSGVTSVKGRKLVVKWKKNPSVDGYTIRYSTDKKFKKNVKTVTVKRKATQSRTLSKLSKGKTYYVQIRTYQGKLTSAWSSAKKGTVKR